MTTFGTNSDKIKTWASHNLKSLAKLAITVSEGVLHYLFWVCTAEVEFPESIRRALDLRTTLRKRSLREAYLSPLLP